MTAPAFQSERGDRSDLIPLINRTNQRAPRIRCRARTAVQISGGAWEDQHVIELGPPPVQALEVVGIDVRHIARDRRGVQRDKGTAARAVATAHLRQVLIERFAEATARGHHRHALQVQAIVGKKVANGLPATAQAGHIGDKNPDWPQIAHAAGARVLPNAKQKLRVCPFGGMVHLGDDRCSMPTMAEVAKLEDQEKGGPSVGHAVDDQLAVAAGELMDLLTPAEVGEEKGLGHTASP